MALSTLQSPNCRCVHSISSSPTWCAHSNHSALPTTLLCLIALTDFPSALFQWTPILRRNPSKVTMTNKCLILVFLSLATDSTLEKQQSSLCEVQHCVGGWLRSPHSQPIRNGCCVAFSTTFVSHTAVGLVHCCHCHRFMCSSPCWSCHANRPLFVLLQ